MPCMGQLPGGAAAGMFRTVPFQLPWGCWCLTCWTCHVPKRPAPWPARGASWETGRRDVLGVARGEAAGQAALPRYQWRQQWQEQRQEGDGRRTDERKQRQGGGAGGGRLEGVAAGVAVTAHLSGGSNSSSASGVHGGTGNGGGAQSSSEHSIATGRPGQARSLAQFVVPRPSAPQRIYRNRQGGRRDAGGCTTQCSCSC